MKNCILSLWLLAIAPSFAQHAHHGSHSNTRPQADAAVPAKHGHSPYSGMQGRAIKSLSDQQIADLKAGKGMSLALAAELNGYPGPSHTLELSAPLGLSEQQKRKTQALFEQMQAEAKALGEQVIASERALDRLFKERKASLTSVQQATADAARVQGALRAAHLAYHLKMVEVLTPDQIAKYNELRGYR